MACAIDTPLLYSRSMSSDWFLEREWILFCDESVGKGEYFSDFYGGALIKASQYERITKRIRTSIKELNLSGEIKWSKSAAFREYILRLQSSHAFADAGIRIRSQDITEVRSHDHPILQCLDVISGAMAFRLNDRHKLKPAGARVRGKRTRAKERLYKDIHAKICQIKPHFNAGISTGTTVEYPTRWDLPYAHWKFIPRNRRVDQTKSKKKPRDA